MKTFIIIVLLAIVIYLIFKPKKKEPPSSLSAKSEPNKNTVSRAKEDPEISQEELLMHLGNKIPNEYLKPQNDLEDTGSFFYKKKVCISGQLDNYPVRPELAKHLWKMGADVDTQVGKTCDILICGDGVGPSKIKKAKAQGVHLMDEDELIEKLDGFTSKYA